jgi:hypothetical protein
VVTGVFVCCFLFFVLLSSSKGKRAAENNLREREEASCYGRIAISDSNVLYTISVLMHGTITIQYR